MQSARALSTSGILLLTISALAGFLQHRHRARPETWARWRIVHVGGTAGAVQLLALSSIWTRLAERATVAAFLAFGLIFATWAFFVGPLARAMGRERLARMFIGAGAIVALPSYILLPLVVWWCP